MSLESSHLCENNVAQAKIRNGLTFVYVYSVYTFQQLIKLLFFVGYLLWHCPSRNSFQKIHVFYSINMSFNIFPLIATYLNQKVNIWFLIASYTKSTHDDTKICLWKSINVFSIFILHFWFVNRNVSVSKPIFVMNAKPHKYACNGFWGFKKRIPIFADFMQL